MRFNLRKLSKPLAATALAAGTIAAAATVAAPAQAAGTYEGCPYGAVCVYPGAGWNGGHPTYVFYSYGPHKIYNQYGLHRVFNNQYGGATSWLCKGSDGTNCVWHNNQYSYTDYNLTPINSVKLVQG
ncbi:hypothetical protein [Kribbella sp.]|uniref:hypothetical protein n=1 Tax=Kribbella sp. TaxID=1871183 RepID=UPI002D5B3ECD|nr:hypothetical protein [Kribbella sp.]HZX06208.1 hypothetical protein [Kribbella sp.]